MAVLPGLNKSIFTQHQNLYFTYWLTLKGCTDNKIPKNDDIRLADSISGVTY